MRPVSKESQLHGFKSGPKPKKRIPAISKKQSKALKEYSVVRSEYLADHPICEVRGCGKRSECIHHKSGKIGKLLTDKKHFFACCLTCHQYYEVHPDEAKKLGYSESRLNK